MFKKVLLVCFLALGLVGMMNQGASLFSLQRASAACASGPAGVNYVGLAVGDQIQGSQTPYDLSYDPGCSGGMWEGVTWTVNVVGKPVSATGSGSACSQNSCHTSRFTGSGVLNVSALAPGTYTATVKVTNEDGNSNSANATFKITPGGSGCPGAAGALNCNDYSAPQVNVTSVTTSGNAVTVQGTYDAGTQTEFLSCGMAGDVPAPAPNSVASFTFSTDDKISGPVTKNVTTPASSWACTTNGSSERGTFTFTFTEPNLTPTHSGLITLQASGVGNYDWGYATFGYGGVPPPTGTIVVNSANSVNGQPVPASWSFSGYPSLDPCSGHGGSCSDTANGTYTGLPVGTYTLAAGTPPASYAFNAERTHEVALTGWNKIAALFRGMVASLAEAATYPSGNPLTLGSSGSTITFTIYWDPIANMSLSQTTWNPSANSGGSSVSQQVNVMNSGAPGSQLAWNAASDSSWLTFSPSSGSGIGQGGSNTVTVTANPSGLSIGTHVGKIIFTGKYNRGGTTYYTGNQTFTVTFNVNTPPAVCGNGIVEPGEQCDQGSSNGPQAPAACNNLTCKWNAGCSSGSCPALPTCTFTANPTTVVVPGQTALTYSCKNVSSCVITASDGEFGSGTSTKVMANDTTGTLAGTPTAKTTYTISCQGLVPGDSNYATSANVNVDIGTPGRCEQNPNGTGCPTP